MIESIDEEGNFTWHCDNPECTHHNCANWKRTCVTHHPYGEAVEGNTHQHHISHEAVRWQNGREVLLPPCHCGQDHTVVTAWPAWAMPEPIITRGVHPVTGREGILDAKIVGAPNFYKKITHMETHVVNGKEVTVEIIDDVVQHPHLAAHQEFGRQLKASGKVPPTQGQM